MSVAKGILSCAAYKKVCNLGNTFATDGIASKRPGLPLPMTTSGLLQPLLQKKLSAPKKEQPVRFHEPYGSKATSCLIPELTTTNL